MYIVPPGIGLWNSSGLNPTRYSRGWLVTGFIRWRLTLHRVELTMVKNSHITLYMVVYNFTYRVNDEYQRPKSFGSLLSIQANHRFLVSIVKLWSMAEFLCSLLLLTKINHCFWEGFWSQKWINTAPFVN